VAIILAPLVAEAGGPASRITKVKGTVNVGNFPATQNVGGTVSVGNLPTVQHVDGTVNVGNLPASQTVSGSVTANPGLPGQPYTAEVGGPTPTVSVPSGKHLVVQTVSITADLTTGSTAPFVDLVYTSGGTAADLYVPLTFVYTSSGFDYYEATVPANIYADPGTSLTLDLTSTGSFGFKFLTVSGYLVG
jgi:hypothetical protein